jgi:hypothetical protein
MIVFSFPLLPRTKFWFLFVVCFFQKGTNANVNVLDNTSISSFSIPKQSSAEPSNQISLEEKLEQLEIARNKPRSIVEVITHLVVLNQIHLENNIDSKLEYYCSAVVNASSRFSARSVIASITKWRWTITRILFNCFWSSCNSKNSATITKRFCGSIIEHHHLQVSFAP